VEVIRNVHSHHLRPKLFMQLTHQASVFNPSNHSSSPFQLNNRNQRIPSLLPNPFVARRRCTLTLLA
jgi:hypothetical protein